jgi:hypothetical protein
VSGEESHSIDLSGALAVRLLGLAWFLLMVPALAVAGVSVGTLLTGTRIVGYPNATKPGLPRAGLRLLVSIPAI